MPAKNSQKSYIAKSYYHLYNRGVEKREIFLDRQDYAVFLSYLKEYLLPKDSKALQKKLSDPTIAWTVKDRMLKALRMNNFYDELSLPAFALMPNHFHLLIWQVSETVIDQFMNSLATRYSMYFNRKYKRVGPLYQGVYKAVLVESDEQLLHLTRYIHRNPLTLQGVALQRLTEYPTSYAEYQGVRKTSWVHTQDILKFFSATNPSLSYRAFVEAEADASGMSTLLIDEE